MRRCSPCWRSYSRWPPRGRRRRPASARRRATPSARAPMTRWSAPSRPRPARARTLPNSPCRTIEPGRRRSASSGPRAGRRRSRWSATATRATGAAAFEYVANAKGWSGLSITRSSCPLQKALRDLREPRRTQCRRWKDDVFAWFAAHPEVRHRVRRRSLGRLGRRAEPRTSRFATSVAGLSRRVGGAAGAGGSSSCATRRASSGDTDACVSRAARRRGTGGDDVRGPAQRSRSGAIRRSSPRRRAGLETLDLTPFFCGARCYPVIGGALVRPRRQPHDRDLLGDARAVRAARARPPHGDVTASVNVSGFV